MKELINIHGEMSEAQAEAVKLHQNIMLNAELAANSMVAMCRDLKIMRDRRLYEELGCAEFSEYTENLVGIKARQAYTYISTYEKLGDTVLQSNATLGITKLSLIAQMNAEDRAEMLESGQADDMTVAELKKLVEENKNQGEQISILNAEIEELKKKESEGADGSELESEIEDLKKQLDEKHALVEKLENDLEKALVSQIEKFLLELGRGFMFVGTQQRVTLNNTHYYVDMVFYNKILLAYVLIELKTTKLTPEAVGQLNMYLNYYEAEINDEQDNPPIGIILCTDKDSIAAEYALGGLSNNIFASRYVSYIPDKEQLIEQVEAVLHKWNK